MLFFDLTRPCDACGQMVGGGVHYCPKCKICFCGNCHFELLYQQRKKYTKSTLLVCPMCGGQFE
jgi:hypothetical protein